MDYLDRLEKAITFIESKLDEDIRIEEIAGVTGYSYYHFHRVFMVVVGESIGSYLRKRRLTKAAQDLLHTDKRILDIAMEYQFESQEAFNRAFKKLYQVSPGLYRCNRLNQFMGEKKPLTSFRLKHLRDGVTVQPEIRTMSERRIVGIKGKTRLNRNQIPELWQGLLPRIPEIQNKKSPFSGFGVCEVNPEFNLTLFTEETEYSEMVGVEVEDFRLIPPEMEVKIIPGGKYAVFTHCGRMDKLGITYDYIWGTWLLCSGFEIDLRDDFELYDERFLGPENDSSIMEIFIPIK